MKYLLSLLLVFGVMGCEYTAPDEEEILLQNGSIANPYIIEEYSDNKVFNLKSGNSHFNLHDMSSNCYVSFQTDYDRLDTIDYNSSKIGLYSYNINGEIVNVTLLTDYNYRDIGVIVRLFNNAFATVTVDCRNDYWTNLY